MASACARRVAFCRRQFLVNSSLACSSGRINGRRLLVLCGAWGVPRGTALSLLITDRCWVLPTRVPVPISNPKARHMLHVLSVSLQVRASGLRGAPSCWCEWSRGGGGARANHAPCHIQHSPGTPTTGLRERQNDTSKSTGRSGRQNAATRRNMRREERVTVQGPVKEQQPDGMSHRGARAAAVVVQDCITCM